MVNNKIKVAILSELIPHYRIPVFQRLSNISSLDVEIIATLPHPSKHGGVKNIEFSGKFKESRMRLWVIKLCNRRLIFTPDLISYLLRKRPDVMISWGIIQPVIINFPIWLISKFTGTKIISWGNWGFKEAEYLNRSYIDKWLSWMRKIIFRWNFAKAYIVYGDFTADYLTRYRGIPKKRIFIAYNSTDTDELNIIENRCRKMPPILPENKYRMIYIGRLVTQKRVDVLLKALQAVKRKLTDVELLIIGDGPESQKLKNMAKELLVEDNVQFLGALYDNILKGRYMIASKLFVLPGLGGLAINEAMLFGLPVICSEADGTEKHLVYDEFTGYLARNNDIDDYTEKILLVLQNEELQSEMGKNARRIILEKVNIQNMVQGFLDAIFYVMRMNIKN